jgi:hypothetical protein
MGMIGMKGVGCWPILIRFQQALQRRHPRPRVHRIGGTRPPNQTLMNRRDMGDL